MKTNKITLMIMGLAVASLFASCKKNDNNAVVGEGFRAFTEQGGNGSRTHGVADGNTIEVQWTASDQILVANQGGTGSTLTYNLKGGANSTEGSFSSVNESNDFLQPDYVAIYPATNAAGVANTISGTTATFNLPATQAYLEGSFAEKAMPMVAYSTEQSLQFKNVLGGLCFPVVGNTKVTKVEVISADANEALWGACTTTVSSDPTSIVSNTETNKNVITLDCGSGIVLDVTTATDFYVMVPAGTLESGFKVKAYNGVEVIYEKSTTNAPGAGFIPRSTVRKVNSNLSMDIAVTTISPTFITKNSSKAMCRVSLPVDEMGILYANVDELNGGPDALVVGGSGVHQKIASSNSLSYEVDLTSLAEDKVHYVRAYAVTDVGTTIYGEAIPFATRKDYYSSPYNGKLPGVFTVDANNNKVHFSAGNLQYQASTDTWRFAENQWDFVGTQIEDSHGKKGGTVSGSDNSNISSSYSGWIDLFGWGTSGWNCGNEKYMPYDYLSAGESNGDKFGPVGLNSLTGTYANSDWGVYNSNSISNSNDYNWRVLQANTIDGYNNVIDGHTAEWDYLFNGRGCDYRFLHVVLTGVRRTLTNNGHNIYGLVLFPDSFNWPVAYLSLGTGINTIQGCWNNAMTEAKWSLLEKEGAIFLPAGGGRMDSSTGTVVEYAGEWGRYWTVSHRTNSDAYSVFIGSGSLNPTNSNYRHHGESVRLVCPAN